MQQHIYYTKYALQFADMQIPELVNIFNRLVGNHGWSSMRAYHDQALIDEFQRRGIDTTAVTAERPYRLSILSGTTCQATNWLSSTDPKQTLPLQSALTKAVIV